MSTCIYTKSTGTYFTGNVTHQVTSYTLEAALPPGTKLSNTLAMLETGRWCYLLNVEGALLLTDGYYNIPVVPENEAELAISESRLSVYIEMTDRLVCRPLSEDEKFAVLADALKRGGPSEPPQPVFQPYEPMEIYDEDEEAVQPLPELVEAESESPLDSSQAETPDESEPDESEPEEQPEEEADESHESSEHSE